mmetsp:Transcript_18808/g.23677  ORF Transcript_18808/g.23677 Transcript_18808/m.23677 type:complete len:174 (+) Transcript_18808:2-523(+)
MAGTTFMMIGTTPLQRDEHSSSLPSSCFQEKTYNSIKIALGERMGIPPYHLVDTSWLAHTLSSPDAHGLRCDIYRETITWDSPDDSKTFEFILSLNDYWSTTMAMWNDSLNAWWRHHGVDGLSSNTKSDEKTIDELNISVHTGYWMAVPSVGNFEFVRLIPSDIVIKKQSMKV